MSLSSDDLSEDYIGLICEKTSPGGIAEDAAADAQFMCERQFGVSPVVDIINPSNLTFSYVPSHLYYILFELVSFPCSCVLFVIVDVVVVVGVWSFLLSLSFNLFFFFILF